jgi:hypothetical protein
MSSAGFSAVVRGPGTSTAFTVEPTTKITANTVYEIVTDAKRLLDPAVAVVVEVDADGAGAGAYAVAAASTYTIDYLFGRITFLADLGAPATVRVSGSYLPALDLSGVTAYKYTSQRTVLDLTTINNSTGARAKALGLRDLSGSITLNELLSIDNDPGAGVVRLVDFAENATPLLFEASAGGKRFRAWVLLDSRDLNSGGPDDVISNTVNFTGAARAVGAGYGWEA